MERIKVFFGSLLVIGLLVGSVLADFLPQAPIPLAREPQDREHYLMEFRARVSNQGPAATGVTATLSSHSSQTRLLDNELNFGNMAAAASQSSVNSFLVLQARHVQFDPSVLDWRFFHSSNNQPPVASAGDDLMAQVGDQISLDGNGSSDPDGDSLAYSWQMISSPLQSAAILSDSNTIAPGFTVDRPGRYEIELIVTDGQTISQPDRIVVTTKNSPPVAEIAPVSGVLTEQLLQLDGRLSHDPDGDVVSYRWILASAPAGSSAALQASTQPLAVLTPDLPGDYLLQLVVSDGMVDSTTANLTIPVAPQHNHDPVINSIPEMLGEIFMPYSYHVLASDADGNQLHYVLLEAPMGVRLDQNAGVLNWLPSVAGRFDVSFQVEDGQGGFAIQSFTLEILHEDLVLPPDPRSIAPPLDDLPFSLFGDEVQFLYLPPNPVQIGVDPSIIDLKRVAVIRGRVLDKNDEGLPGVEIRVHHHPEYGHTLSREDGRYDMVVNGGGTVTLNFDKAGHLPAQRQLKTPWRDYAQADDLLLIPLDQKATTVDLSGAGAEVQVARSSLIEDESGARQTTIIFPAGIRGAMTLANGAIQQLTNATVRATEYTVGESGPSAMPGDLPPSSGYTFATELSIDEALAAGVSRVDFDRPVPVYVDNYLGFPVGERVPVGWYDRERVAWIPSSDGRVIGVLGITGGLAELDLDGSGIVADATRLAELGIADTERKALAILYAPGATLWRVQVEHFTPWDHNWPWGFPQAAIAPPGTPPTLGDTGEHPPGDVLQLDVPLEGTPFNLHYSSARTEGYLPERTLDITLSGDFVPADLKRIELTIDIAGQHHSYFFPPLPNLNHTFVWNSKDGYGRLVNGKRKYSVDINYVYDMVYYASSADMRASFGLAGDANIIASRQSEIGKFNRHWEGWMGSYRNQVPGLGGWSLDVHHAYQMESRMLYLGSGEQTISHDGALIDRFAGNAQGCSQWPCAGDEGLATEAEFSGGGEGGDFGLAVAADGSVYISDPGDSRVRVIDASGVTHAYAGTGVDEGYDGDGGLATQALLSGPGEIALGPDGSIYVVDQWGTVVRRVSPEGIISTVAGTGEWGFGGDGGPAVDAQFEWISGIAVGADGSLYIADPYSSRIRRVGPNGIVTTIAGTGLDGVSGDGGLARQAALSFPRDIAVAPDGSLYIADSGNARIRRITSDGRIDTVAGTGVGGFSGDGGPADQAQIFEPNHLAFSAAGDLWFTGRELESSVGRIRVITVAGVINTVAGSFISQWDAGFPDQGPEPALDWPINPSVFALGSDNEGYLIPMPGRELGRIFPSLPGFSLLDRNVSSEDGSEYYVFNTSGRHLETRQADPDAPIYSFDYDAEGYLETVTIAATGDVFFIRRAADGSSISLIAPSGEVTELALNPNGGIASLESFSESHDFVYDENGLMRHRSDNQAAKYYNYYYDNWGSLVDAPFVDVLTPAPDVLPEAGATNLVASIPGQFSASGSANYSVPVTVSPGTAGLEPKLSINYNSQSGNGNLGVGWSLSGFSSIHRCAQTLAQDGTRTGIEFNQVDRFCLDGQRLIAVDGQYGANNTEYRTEINSFSKIISRSTQGQGPDYFIVRSKSGELMEYGVTADARVEAQGRQVVRQWTLNRIEDTAGNYLTIRYYENNVNGEHYPLRLDYTGNSRAGIPAFASVQLEYENRPDSSFGFLARSRILNTKRLKALRSFNGSSLVRKYSFDFYDIDFVNPLSRLAQIRSCTDEAESNCVAPTLIQWQKASSGFLEPIANDSSHESHTNGMLTARSLDFNGDGISDLVYTKDAGRNVLVDLYGVDGVPVTHLNTGVPGVRFREGTAFIPMDFNGDGRTEILLPNTSSDHCEQGATFCKPMLQSWKVLSYENGSLKINNREIPGTINTFLPRRENGLPIVFDADGDGLHDILYYADEWLLIRNRGGGDFSVHPTGIFGTRKFQIIDANGDGLQDLLEVNNRLWLSDGTGFRMVRLGWSNPDKDETSIAIDINGDGYQDLVWPSPSKSAS